MIKLYCKQYRFSNFFGKYMALIYPFLVKLGLPKMMRYDTILY